VVLTAALLLGLGDWSARAPGGGGPEGETLAAEPLVDMSEERLAHMPPPLGREMSKKELWLLQKATRPDVHLGAADLLKAQARAPVKRRPPRPAATLRSAPEPLPPPGSRVEPVTTLFNTWTKEAMPILPGSTADPRFHSFLRDHFTNQSTHMDLRLYEVLVRAGKRFDADRIEVVSGYRSPKYNLMLRKKGRQVARSSQHTEGHAVDFRIRGVPTKTLLQFVRSLRLGGVGFYPHSQFVHSDTGPVRFWKGS
jgi:hypothetical protein